MWNCEHPWHRTLTFILWHLLMTVPHDAEHLEVDTTSPKYNLSKTILTPDVGYRWEPWESLFVWGCCTVVSYKINIFHFGRKLLNTECLKVGKISHSKWRWTTVRKLAKTSRSHTSSAGSLDSWEISMQVLKYQNFASFQKPWFPWSL